MLEYYRFKEVSDLFTRGKTEEARLRLMELQSRYVSLCDENAALRSQVQGYEDILYLSRNLIHDGMYYWLITGSIKQGPFCPSCYNRDGVLLRLGTENGEKRCGVCLGRFSHRVEKTEQALSASGTDDAPVRRGKVIPFTR